MLYHYYFKSLQPLLINIQEWEFYIWTVKTFYKIDNFLISPFETCLGSRHLYFLKYKQGIHVCVVSNFHPGLEKMSIIWKFWNFHPGLKFHLGLAKPSWNFNSVYRVEIFTCNYNVILKRSLLFSRDKISARYTELKFQPGFTCNCNVILNIL